jgi:hypothetical protein
MSCPRLNAIPRSTRLFRLPLVILTIVIGGALTGGTAAWAPPASAEPSSPAATASLEPIDVTVFNLPASVTKDVLAQVGQELGKNTTGLVVVKIAAGARFTDDLSKQRQTIEAIFAGRDRLAAVAPDFLAQLGSGSGSSGGGSGGGSSGGGSSTGLGDVGSLLFALANYRLGTPDESAAAFTAVNHAGQLCGDACQKLLKGTGDEAGHRAYDLAHGPTFADVALRGIRTQVFPPAPPTSAANVANAARPPKPNDTHPKPTPSSGSGGGSALTWLLVAIVVLAVAAGAVWWSLTRASPGSRADRQRERDLGARSQHRRPRSDPRLDDGLPVAARTGGSGRDTGSDPEPLRARVGQAAPVHRPDVPVGAEGIVRSPFTPTGYVLVEGGGLYRAVWRGDARSRPVLGDRVALAEDQRDGLVALPLAHRRNVQQPAEY